MQTQSGKKTLLFGLLALILLLAIGGGLFLVLRPTAQPEPNPGPSNALITPTTSTAGGNGPVKAEPGDTIVTLTWEPVENATGYFVHRDGARDPLNVKAIQETRYMDIGLTNGRVYTYTVSPVLGGVEGAAMPAVQAAPGN